MNKQNATYYEHFLSQIVTVFGDLITNFRQSSQMIWHVALHYRKKSVQCH